MRMLRTQFVDANVGEILIEKGIPISSKRSRSDRYPWHSMEVGDSFLFPADLQNVSGYNVVRATNLRLAPKAFKASKTEHGLRCWRTA